MKRISLYETILVAHTRSRKCDGVICGHIHAPTIAEDEAIAYCKTGDWVETRTAIVEHHDGRLELRRYYPTIVPHEPGRLPQPLRSPLIEDWRNLAAPVTFQRESATC